MKSMKKQKGLVVILVTLLFMVLLAFGALAIDINHMVLNKARLQNSVDAAAIAAAIIVDDSDDVNAATIVANNTLTNMALTAGNSELDFESTTISITYSNDPQTFPDSTFDASEDIYVRVEVEDLSMLSYFIQIMGIDKQVSASAVAGPSAALNVNCNLVPMAVCANSPTSIEGVSVNGYNFEEVYALKMSTQSSPMGPGNFQLLDFGQGDDTSGGGAKLVQQALAGAYQGCGTINQDVTTKPGSSTGPVSKGLNTRFDGGTVDGTELFPDEFTQEPDDRLSIDKHTGEITNNDTSGSDGNPWGYDDYLAGKNSCTKGASNCPSNGVAGRRELQVPIVDCSITGSGKIDYPVVSFGCFFLVQSIDKNNSQGQPVMGEFAKECYSANGSTGVIPEKNGVYKIQLYKDPLSGDS